MGQRAISSAVERLPYKQDVAGSKPASRIIKNLSKTGVLVEEARALLSLLGRKCATFCSNKALSSAG